jgi:NAD(P)-dependent dehydrogenase (short-subunit alcohol dehydrogenase family)
MRRMGAVAITGSASGIGAAIATRLESDGHRIIGVDLRDAEVLADLSTPTGRRDAIEAVTSSCAGELEGLVTCAGIPGDINPGDIVVSINYFGSASLLEGLRPALARGTRPSAIAISSLSTTVMPDIPDALIEACLAGDEPEARSLAAKNPGAAYAASKLAIARYVRRNAVTEPWAGTGIRLNAIAPGRIRTPLDDALLADPRMRTLLEALPIPAGGPGTPQDVASLVGFLMSSEARFFCGAVLFIDGGTDALIRPDAWPATYRTQSSASGGDARPAGERRKRS